MRGDQLSACLRAFQREMIDGLKSRGLHSGCSDARAWVQDARIEFLPRGEREKSARHGERMALKRGSEFACILHTYIRTYVAIVSFRYPSLIDIMTTIVIGDFHTWDGTGRDETRRDETRRDRTKRDQPSDGARRNECGGKLSQGGYIQ